MSDQAENTVPVGTPPSADDQTVMRLAYQRVEQYRVDGHEALADAVWNFSHELLRENVTVEAEIMRAELTRLRAERDAQKTTSHLRLEAALHEERGRKSAEAEIARLRAENVELRDELARLQVEKAVK